MISNEKTRNIRLGIFVLISIIIFLVTIFYLGSQNNYFNKTFIISTEFKNVEGLKEGDNVWLSGVKIGTVKKVQIVSEGKVNVTLSLKDKQNEFIKKDATAFIGSDGFIGNKIVIIRPGNASRAIENGDVIESFSPTDTQELFNLAKDVGSNTESITDELKLITERLNKGEGFIGGLLRDGQVSNDIRIMIKSLKDAGENTNRLTDELRVAVNEITSGDGLVNKLFVDTSYVAKFENTLNNVAEVSASTKQMSNELKVMIAKMNDESNAVGVLLQDTAFANSLKATMENAEAASEKLDENMKAVRKNFLFRKYFKKKEKERKKEK